MACPAAPPFLEHRKPVHLRQADIEHDGVVGLGVAEEVAFLAVERDVDRIAGVGQRLLELAVEIGIVFDDEKAHGDVPSTPGDDVAITGVDQHSRHFPIARQ